MYSMMIWSLAWLKRTLSSQKKLPRASGSLLTLRVKISGMSHRLLLALSRLVSGIRVAKLMISLSSLPRWWSRPDYYLKFKWIQDNPSTRVASSTINQVVSLEATAANVVKWWNITRKRANLTIRSQLKLNSTKRNQLFPRLTRIPHKCILHNSISTW